MNKNNFELALIIFILLNIVILRMSYEYLSIFERKFTRVLLLLFLNKSNYIIKIMKYLKLILQDKKNISLPLIQMTSLFID